MGPRGQPSFSAVPARLRAVSLAAGWIAKWFTGERRAALRQSDAAASLAFQQAAASTLTMYVEMRDKYDAIQKKYDDLECRMDAVENENRDLRKEIHDLRSENQGLKEELHIIRAENQELKKELGSIRTENQELKQTLAKRQGKGLHD